MLDKQIETFCVIIRDEDLAIYSGRAFENLIDKVFGSGFVPAVKGARDVKDYVLHIPMLIFWDKVKRFLFGTFHDYSDQVELASKFNNENAKYKDYIKRLIYVIDEVDDERKIDFYSSLTRCFLLTNLDSQLYFKLVKFLDFCTTEELEYIKSFEFQAQVECNTMISVLYNWGLFFQIANNEGSLYCLSDFGKALKLNCLNFTDEFKSPELPKRSYEDIKPLQIVEPMTEKSISKLLESDAIGIPARFS